MIFMEAVGPSITIIKERSGEKNKEANFLMCDGKLDGVTPLVADPLSIPVPFETIMQS